MSIHISSEDRMWYSGNMLDAVLYVFVGCFVVRGCAVTRRFAIVICLVLFK